MDAADDPYAAADHGLDLKPAVIAPKLALMSRQTLHVEEIPFVIGPAIEVMFGLVNDLGLQPNGVSITIFKESDSPAGPDGQPLIDFTFVVPLAEGGEVPVPYMIEETPRFACVTYRHTGHVGSPAMLWPKVMSKAAFDGHELTGTFRLEGVKWVGFSSNQNVFSMQVGIVEE